MNVFRFYVTWTTVCLSFLVSIALHTASELSITVHKDILCGKPINVVKSFKNTFTYTSTKIKKLPIVHIKN